MNTELSVAGIENTRGLLSRWVDRTPVRRWHDPELQGALGPRAEVFLKEELFQRTGTFKPRGAFSVMLRLSDDERARGVVTFSAGNHALAVAYAAQALGTTAVVFMPRHANSARVTACRNLGAEVCLVPDAQTAAQRASELAVSAGRSVVHPFEGERTILGTATLGAEICESLPDLDAVIVPIGGGGLCAGVAAAVKLYQPRCRVFGVEPTGADTMHQSFLANAPQTLQQIATVADSLAAPFTLPETFNLCRRYLDDLVLVEDMDIIRSLQRLFSSAKLAVEPAGAVATAGLWGPLRQRLLGKRVCVIVCGANIDRQTFARLLAVDSLSSSEDAVQGTRDPDGVVARLGGAVWTGHQKHEGAPLRRLGH